MKKILLTHYRLFVYFVKFILLIAILLLGYHFLVKPEGKKIFYISATDSHALYEDLQKNHYTMYPIDKLYLPFITLPKKGWYRIDKKTENRFTFFSTLHNKQIKEKTIKIFAAQSAEEISTRLAKNLDLNSSKFLHFYKKLTLFGEGDLFSGSYHVAKGADEESIMQYLFDTSKQKLLDFEKKYEDIHSNTLEHKILRIIASIIQKESNNPHEMPLIASVIYNRLEKNMKLQMDGTLNYGKYSHQVVNAERIKTDKSSYNTYKYKGLPPAPLCSISIQALEAAYLPETTKYLFFMLNKDGTHDFASTYKEHLANIRAFKHPKKVSIKNTPKDVNLSDPAIASVK